MAVPAELRAGTGRRTERGWKSSPGSRSCLPWLVCLAEGGSTGSVGSRSSAGRIVLPLNDFGQQGLEQDAARSSGGKTFFDFWCWRNL